MSSVPVYYIEAEPVYTATVGQGAHLVCVTSAERFEGVSTVAYSIARRGAAGGRRTLLIDFNLYNPSVGNRLGIRQTEWDFDDRSYEDAIIDFPEINLSILPAPRMSFASTSLLEKENIQKHLSYLGEKYDTIVIDCAPVNTNNFRDVSGQLIASISDATILVVLGGTSTQHTVQLAVEKLQQAGARIAGSVMNDYDNPGLSVEIQKTLDNIVLRLPFLSKMCKKFSQTLHNLQESM